MSLIAASQNNGSNSSSTKTLKTQGSYQTPIKAPLAKQRFSQNIQQTKNGRTITYAIIIWVLVSLLFVTLLIWFNWWKPIRQLNRYMEYIANGRFDFPISVNGAQGVQKLAWALERLRSKLSQKEKQQKDFLQHVSHELKTPLASIKEGTSLLNDHILGALNHDQQEVVTILQDNIAELQSSIENLLNYNETLSASPIKRRVNTNLTKLLHKAVKKHKLQIKSKNLLIKLRSDEVRAFVDKAQILTAFNNLLSNAIKFSNDSGLISLNLKKEGDQITFTIADEGCGIDEQDKKHIFDAFYIGEQPHQHSLRGTGLGLSIARQYIEMNDGKIRLIDSDIGATFEIKLRA